MSEMIELSENELETVAGGQLVEPVNVQTNVIAAAEVAIALAVLSPNAVVNASNKLVAVQVSSTAFT
jgi:bacteriocin-like protein